MDWTAAPLGPTESELRLRAAVLRMDGASFGWQEASGESPSVWWLCMASGAAREWRIHWTSMRLQADLVAHLVAAMLTPRRAFCVGRRVEWALALLSDSWKAGQGVA